MVELIKDKQLELGIKQYYFPYRPIVNQYFGGEKVISYLWSLYGDIADYEAEWVTLTLEKKGYKLNLSAIYWIEDDYISEDILLKENIGFKEICKLLKIIASEKY